MERTSSFNPWFNLDPSKLPRYDKYTTTSETQNADGSTTRSHHGKTNYWWVATDVAVVVLYVLGLYLMLVMYRNGLLKYYLVGQIDLLVLPLYRAWKRFVQTFVAPARDIYNTGWYRIEGFYSYETGKYTPLRAA